MKTASECGQQLGLAWNQEVLSRLEGTGIFASMDGIAKFSSDRIQVTAFPDFGLIDFQATFDLGSVV
jgi:hypothetical protein